MSYQCESACYEPDCSVCRQWDFLHEGGNVMSIDWLLGIPYSKKKYESNNNQTSESIEQDLKEQDRKRHIVNSSLYEKFLEGKISEKQLLRGVK